MVINTDQIDQPRHISHFTTKYFKAGPLKPHHSPFDADVEFMVPGYGVFAVWRSNMTKGGKLGGKRIGLTVYKISRANQKIRFRFLDGLYEPVDLIRSGHKTQMKIRNLHDAEA